MESIQLEKSELFALLDLQGLNEIVGIQPEQLPPPEPFERAIIIDDGRSRLIERQWLTVEEDHYQVGAELESMLAVLANPESVLRIRRTSSRRAHQLWYWYFISGAQLVLLAASGQEQFELSRISNVEGALAQIGEILPAEPVPGSRKYRATVDKEDADLISALVDDWDEVPALTIMEADGLTPAAALELFDDLTAPVWSGQVDFMACSSGQVTVYHRILVLQGQELSWLAWQDDPDKSDLHIQSATAGAFEEHIVAYLSEVIAKM